MDALLSTTRTMLLTLVAALMAVVGNAADVTLRPTANVASGLIRLGDIADITPIDDPATERLTRLPLMPAPAPGTQTVITAQGVRELVVASGEDLGSLRFSGSLRVTIGETPARPAKSARRTFVDPSETEQPVNRRSRKQTGFRSSLNNKSSKSTSRSRGRVSLSRRESDDLTTNLQRLLTDFARRQTGDASLQATNTEIASRNLADLSRATSSVDIIPTDAITTGRQRFLLSFTTDYGPIKFPVYTELQQARPAVFLVRSVPRGATITRADVEVRPLPFDTRLSPTAMPFAALEEVIGKEAAKVLRPDTLLNETNCLPPLLVRRGSEVSVVAGGGGIRVRMQALAKANGRLGEIIPVETGNSRERLLARVVGNRELAVLSASGNAYTASLPRSYR